MKSKIHNNNYKVLTDIKSLEFNSKIYIWGAGETGQEFYTHIRKNRPDLEVLGFIDSYKNGNYCGFKGFQPEQLLKDPNPMLIICSMFWGEIIKIIGDFYSKNFLVLSNEIICECSQLRSFGSFYFKESDSNSMNKRLDKLMPYFNTDHDREIFQNLFNLRVNRQETMFMDYMNELCEKQNNSYKNKDKYVPNIKQKKIKHIIEGGMYDGEDTYNLLKIFKESSEFKKIYSFEPYIDALRAGDFFNKIDFNKCEVVQKILWDSCEKLVFNVDKNNPGNSSIERAEDVEVGDLEIHHSVTIDDFAQKNNISVDLIKLDIEGAEINALMGAEKSIIKYKPFMAISIYHRKQDMFEIPELLIKFDPNYRFSMSVSGPSFIDMVLNASC